MAQLQNPNIKYVFKYETIPGPVVTSITPEGHTKYTFPSSIITAIPIKKPPNDWIPPKGPKQLPHIDFPKRIETPPKNPFNHGPFQIGIKKTEDPFANRRRPTSTPKIVIPPKIPLPIHKPSFPTQPYNNNLRKPYIPRQFK